MSWSRLIGRAGVPADLPAGEDERPVGAGERALADFTMTPEILKLLPLAALIGIFSAVVALILLNLIGLLLNLLYFQRAAVTLNSPVHLAIGAWSIPIPVAGGLIVGLMARYGSERIRGHGIPEAIESILINGSKVAPRLVVLKPISSAIAIGTGGPFGAEGPIIMTGGSLGSVIAQLFRLSAAQRRALLVAGACAGMTAVFGTPVAAAMLAVELLLFELKPRSIIPVGVACVVAEVTRDWFARLGLILGAPLFPMHAARLTGALPIAEAAFVGLLGGVLAWVLTKAVYAAEDAFRLLPIHWMWWPAIGGIVVGVGGFFEPRALAVGYNTIRAELAGHLALTGLLALLVVKLVIWALALGSGTSGGILAPLLMMGAAMGGLVTPILHGGSPGTWALIGMAGTLAGVMRAPFTSVLFAFELTRSVDTFLPILAAGTVAYLVSVLLLRRSILTEKVARRGFHLLREYAVDPLEAVFVREVMLTDVLSLHPDSTVADLRQTLRERPQYRRQRLYPIVADDGGLLGVVPDSCLHDGSVPDASSTRELMRTDAVVVVADATLHQAADVMALARVGALPVVEPGTRRVRGVLTQFDLLRGRERQLHEERHREQPLTLWRVRRGASVPTSGAAPAPELLEDNSDGDGRLEHTTAE